MILTKDKKFYKSAVSIALPIALQNLITFSVHMADTVMLGKLGEVSLSASVIANHLFFTLMVLMFGIGGGASVLCSQYYGKKDISSIHKIMSIMYRVCIVLSIIFILVAIFVPRIVMNIYTDDIDIINEGVKYLKIIWVSYIFYAVTNCTISVLRSVKTVKISIVVYSISLLVNIFFNWVLIFGKLGFPELQIQGAAIATVLSRITEFLVVLIYMILFEKKIKINIKSMMKVEKSIVDTYLKTATPIFLNELFWSIGASIISIIVSRMGREVVAANSINNVTNQFASLFIFGFSSASSVIIGNTIGKGQYDKVREYAKTISILSFFMGIFSAIIIYFLRNYVVDIYNISNETKEVAKNIMLATSITTVFRAISSNVTMGVLRGAGDNKFVFKMEMAFLWLVSIPLGYIAAYIFNLPITIVFLLIRSDDVLKAIGGLIRIRGDKWINDLTKK